MINTPMQFRPKVGLQITFSLGLWLTLSLDYLCMHMDFSQFPHTFCTKLENCFNLFPSYDVLSETGVIGKLAIGEQMAKKT